MDIKAATSLEHDQIQVISDLFRSDCLDETDLDGIPGGPAFRAKFAETSIPCTPDDIRIYLLLLLALAPEDEAQQAAIELLSANVVSDYVVDTCAKVLGAIIILGPALGRIAKRRTEQLAQLDLKCVD